MHLPRKIPIFYGIQDELKGQRMAHGLNTVLMLSIVHRLRNLNNVIVVLIQPDCIIVFLWIMLMLVLTYLFVHI